MNKRYCGIILASLLVAFFMPMVPQAHASVTESPGTIQLTGNEQVKINGPITVGTNQIYQARWVGNQYFLDVTGEHGNTLHAIMEFYYYMSSESKDADFYVVRIVVATVPHPDDAYWRLPNQGVDDPIGPAGKVYAKVTTGAIRWDWCVPWDTYDYDKDLEVLVSETYSIGTSFEGGAYVTSDGAGLGVKGSIDESYMVKNEYTVSLYRWTVKPVQGTTEFTWKLGLNTELGQRNSAIGEYLLVLTAERWQTIHIDNLQFDGNLWHWHPIWGADILEYLRAKIESIDIDNLYTLTVDARDQYSNMAPTKVWVDGRLVGERWTVRHIKVRPGLHTIEVEDVLYVGPRLPCMKYSFQKWNDGVYDNPRTVDIQGHVTYTALYYSQVASGKKK